MNINEMKEEEKSASESDTVVSEEKNADGQQVVDPTGTQGALNMNMDEVPVEKEAEEAARQVDEPLKPGAQLAAIRVAAGIDQEQVAASLKMTVRQVRELEADNYEALHGVAISRGFIRAYAKMLQVDPEPLVGMFKTEESASKQLDQIPKQNVSERFTLSSSSLGKRRSMGKKSWLILIALILAVLYGAHSMKWFSGGSSSFKKKAEPVVDVTKQEASRSASPETGKPGEEVPGTEKAAASLGDASGKDSKAVEAEPAKKDEGAAATGDKVASQDTDKSATSSQSDQKEKAAESQPEKAVEAAPVVPQNFLVVHFNGPSRVQVLKKANASVLREFDGKAGDMQKLEISEPVTLVIEKAANVQVEFREQPLLLKTARRSSEARVELK